MTSEELERLASLQQELLSIYEFWPQFVCERAQKGEFMPYGGFEVTFRKSDEDDDELQTLFASCSHEDQVDVRQVCFEALMAAFRKRASEVIAELNAAGITDLEDPPEDMFP